MKKFFENAHKYIPYLFYCLFLFLVVRSSYGNALDFYFWKDDWAWLWSSNYNPQDFYRSTVGETWIVRTGLFMRPYVLYFHKVIQDSTTWQTIGLILKFVNSLLFFFFTYTITKDKRLSVAGSFIFASYSGGVESYTWHKLNAFVTSFTLLGFAFYARFIEAIMAARPKNNFALMQFILAFCFFALAFASYMGRAAGLVPVLVFWSFLEFIRKDIKKETRKKILFATVIMVASYFFLIRVVSLVQPHSVGYFQTVITSIPIFFGIVGNLLRNPLFKIDEFGYLATPDKLSYFLGYGVFFAGLIIGLIYIFRRNINLRFLVLFIGWIYLFYFPNWVFGGGGVTTLISSGHRYFALAGVGVIALGVTILKYIDQRIVVLICLLLVALNLKYSNYLISLESSVRNRYLVEPIYQKLNEKMASDDRVQLIVIDTPNILKSFVVAGWYPYTFAYYNGLTEVTEFPVVIPYWDYGVTWICGDENKKNEIQGTGGFVDYQNLPMLDPEHVYAWSLSENGNLTNKTEALRNVTRSCNALKVLNNET